MYIDKFETAEEMAHPSKHMMTHLVQRRERSKSLSPGIPLFGKTPVWKHALNTLPRS